MMPPPDVDRLRAETPGCEHRIHFNNAGAGLMPTPVLTAMIEHLELEARIGGCEAADARADAVADFYDATGELLGCAASNVAFTANATDSFSRALSSIPFEAGDTILTTEDDYWDRLAHVSGVRILDEGRRKAAIVTFTIEGRSAAEVAASLAEQGINSSVSLREHAQYDLGQKGVASCVRLSPHYYNTEEETERVVAAISDVAA